MLHDLITQVITWYMGNINYWTIGILMAVEGSAIPFPSEIVVPPAAWKAAQGDLNIYGVVAAASIGALCGSLVNYFLALTLGRPLLYKFAASKWARLLLINEHHLENAEKYFLKYGSISTFIGRLVPVIRQLIAIPAGLSKMNLKQFCFFTFLGATIWNIILSFLGVFLYSQKDKLEHYYQYISYGFLAVGFIFVVFLIIKSVQNRKKALEKVAS